MTRVSIRKLAERRAVPLGNLIKADVHQTIVAADRALIEAEAAAERAFEAAAAKGRDAGMAEGRDAGAKLLAETVAETRAYLRDADQALARIVVDAVRRIVGSFDDAELAARIVAELLREAAAAGGGTGTVRLWVAPGDLATVRDRIAAVQAERPEIEAVEVVADAQVVAGGCRIETDLGFLATSIDERLESLCAALAEHAEG